MLKVSTFCSGIGSPEQAIKNLGIKHEIIFACERDKYALQTYKANHSANKYFDDMTTMYMAQQGIYSDLTIGGIPCQSFSLAGKRLGEDDKRGLLFYDFYNYIKLQQPKYFIIENVKGLLSDDKGRTFHRWIDLLSQSVNNQYVMPHSDSLMYNVHCQVLNTKDYGLPQNRERIFIVGIRNDLPNTFLFPKGFKLELRLKDILEPIVDEKYYLSQSSINALYEHKKRNEEMGNGFGFSLNDTNGICSTVKIGGSGKDDLIEEPICAAMRGRNPDNSSDRTTGAPTEQRLEINSQGITNTITSVQKDNLIIIPEATQRGYAIAKEGDSINLSQINSKTRRGRVGNQIAQTLDTGSQQYCVQKQKIRRLTPTEVFRLQGFHDEFIKPVSDTQKYKQAGNTISVSVIQSILKNLLKQ